MGSSISSSNLQLAPGPKLVVSEEDVGRDSSTISRSEEVSEAQGQVQLDTHSAYRKTWSDLAEKGWAVGGTLIALRGLAYVATLGSSEMLVVGLIGNKVAAAKAREETSTNHFEINVLLEQRIRHELGDQAAEEYRDCVAPYLSQVSAAALLEGMKKSRNHEAVEGMKDLIAEMRPKELWDSDARRLFLLLREKGMGEEMTGLESARGLLTKDQFQGLYCRLADAGTPTEVAQFRADFAAALHEAGYRGVKQASV